MRHGVGRWLTKIECKELVRGTRKGESQKLSRLGSQELRSQEKTWQDGNRGNDSIGRSSGRNDPCDGVTTALNGEISKRAGQEDRVLEVSTRRV
jgi:hypothetical protein